MAETASVRRNGFDRFNEALRSLDEEIQELRARVDRGRRRVEGEIRKRADRVRTEIRRTDLYRRADQIRKDIEGQVGRGRAQIYELFGIATKEDVERLNRKINQIARRLAEITKESVAV
jgi:polyhydroxyalkanoate synthesis regulator phasin